MLPSKKALFDSKKSTFSEKILKFLYSHLTDFAQTAKVNGVPMSQNFLENLKEIIRNEIFIHDSHVAGEVIGYDYSFYKEKVRENYYKIPVVAQNLFKFDFFFFLKGLWASVWATKNIGIRVRNATDINFGNIGTLASNLTNWEKNSIRAECKKFLQKDEMFSKKLNSLTQNDQEWVLNYLSTGKGTIPVEIIKRYDSLDIEPEDGKFFL